MDAAALAIADDIVAGLVIENNNNIGKLPT